MSYADSLTEADEFLTYEEGRLQGMLDLRRLLRRVPDILGTINVVELISKNTNFESVIQEQQTLVDEIRGEEE